MEKTKKSSDVEKASSPDEKAENLSKNKCLVNSKALHAGQAVYIGKRGG